MNDYRSHSETVENLLAVYDYIDGEFAQIKHSRDVSENRLIHEAQYQPSEGLKKYISEFREWCSKNPGKSKAEREAHNIKAGELMEQIAGLAFQSLRGETVIESFYSLEFQLDLAVSGNMALHWKVINTIIGFHNQRTAKIIIEAKNRNKPIDTTDFSRLCYIVEHQFREQCLLGIFFSRKSASGFTKAGNQQRSLKAARATQILFHRKTGKYVIVFDYDDILSLVHPGSLTLLIAEKIEDIENVVGTHLIDFDNDLPKHTRMNQRLPDHIKQALEESSPPQ
jgi:hypothetical protein